MLPPPGPSLAPIGIALSGGGDSVALLHILHRLGYRLHALHLNHLLRAAESDADEHFVRHLCRSLAIPLTVQRANPSASGANLEAAGRRLRRDFFASARRQHSLHRIATGHTQSDQAETLLLRLLRGAGPRGLAAILPITREGLIRPLLDLSRDQLRSWLAAEHLPFRDDSTNTDPARLRNRIRLQLLPALARDYNPAAAPALARYAHLAYLDERYWSNLTRRLLPRHFTPAPGPSLIAPAAPLLRLPAAVLFRLLRAALDSIRHPGPELSLDHLEQTAALLHSPSATATLPGLTLERSFHLLRIARPYPPPAPYSLDIPQPGRYPVPGGEVVIHHREPPPHPAPPATPVSTPPSIPYPAPVSASPSTLVSAPSSASPSPPNPTPHSPSIPASSRVYNTEGSGLDPAILDRPLRLCNWKPGDGYRPLGAARSYKLKELFQKARIPSWERPSWPILWCNGAIVWARRFGPAAEAASYAANAVCVEFDPTGTEMQSG